MLSVVVHRGLRARQLAGLVGLLLAGCPDDAPPGTSEGTETSGSSSSDESTVESGSSGEPSSSSGLGTSGSVDDGSTSSGSGGESLSFADDIWPVLAMDRDPPLSGRNASCNSCHGANGTAGLSFPDPATGYASLLDDPSTSELCAGAPRVIPGEPDGSCFVIFYELRLRDSLAWVDAEETALIRAWVESGAAP
jgi:hypothetical protein